MRKNIFLSNGRKLSYLEYGHNNKDVLLCLHGLTRNACDFDYLAKYMQNDLRIICVDFAGHGESDYLSDYNQYHYLIFLDDIEELLRTLNIDSVYWLGNSLGGIVGFFAFERNNKLIKKLILNDVGPQLSPHSLASLQNVNIPKLAPMFIYPTYDEAKQKIMKMFSGFKFPEQEHLEHYMNHTIKHLSSGFYGVNYDVGVLSLFVNTNNVMRKEGVWDLWQKINVPILEMWGRKSALLTPPLIARMKETNSNLTVCTCMSDAHVCNLMEESQLSFIKKWIFANDQVPDATLP